MRHSYCLLAFITGSLLFACASSDGSSDASSGGAAAPSSTDTPSPTPAPSASSTTDTPSASPAQATVAATFAVRGTVTGLAGTGLVLQNEGGDDLAVSAAGAFAFKTALAAGKPYAVTVNTQPALPAQQCVVSNGAGTIGSADVTDVAVTCTTSNFSVGGTVSGLSGGSLVLKDNGGDDLTVSQDGTFAFASQVASGGAYAVTIASQPAGETCTVSGGSGTVGAGKVSSVLVNCAPNTYAVGGTVTGLLGTLVLQNEGKDDLSVTANGSFAFATPVASGSPYEVTVLTPPSGPSQTCTITGGSGSVGMSNVSDVAIACVTNTYKVAVSVSGAKGTGLVLENNGGDDLSIAADGDYSFALPITDGQPYAVTVLSSPSSPLQFCTVADASGTISGADVKLQVACTTANYKVKVNVMGLQGTGLVLQNNGGSDLSVDVDGTYSWVLDDGQPYAVSILSQPTNPDQTCTVTNGSGTVNAGEVTDIVVTCL